MPGKNFASQAELATVFERATETIFDASNTAALTKLASNKEAVITAASNGVSVTATGGDPNLFLPSFASGKHFVMRVVIDSPAATAIQLFWLVNGQRAHDEAHSQIVPLRRGSNTVYLQVDQGDIIDPLRLDPGGVTGEYTIQSIVAKAIQ
jgi:hypothetical protein